MRYIRCVYLCIYVWSSVSNLFHTIHCRPCRKSSLLFTLHLIQQTFSLLCSKMACFTLTRHKWYSIQSCQISVPAVAIYEAINIHYPLVLYARLYVHNTVNTTHAIRVLLSRSDTHKYSFHLFISHCDKGVLICKLEGKKACRISRIAAYNLEHTARHTHFSLFILVLSHYFWDPVSPTTVSWYHDDHHHPLPSLFSWLYFEAQITMKFCEFLLKSLKQIGNKAFRAAHKICAISKYITNE